MVAARVLGIELVGTFDRAGEHAATERAVGDEADAELLADGKHFSLGIARPERIFGLQRRDRMHLERASYGCSRCLGQTEMAHLACLDEFGHGADGVLDRDLAIDAMLV